MLRRQARLRHEYIYRKSIEQRQRLIAEKKERLSKAIEENKSLPTDLRREALQIEKTLKWNDGGGDGVTTHMDDEYKWAGVEDPKVMVTTSRDPSSKLKQFAKEVRLLIPNSQRINRGKYDEGQLMAACRANDVTDLIILHEYRGVPDNLVVCHLPFGPTAFFSLSNVVMRHDIPDVGMMSEVFPHLIFHGFSTHLGARVISILKYLFPVPKDESQRVMTFATEDDYISFRHHTFKKVDKNIELKEIGPRFEMKLYKILLGTLENARTADVEWVLRPYMNTTKKRTFLTKETDT